MGPNNSKYSDLEYLRSILERGPAVVYHCQEYWDYGVDYISPNIEQLLGWRSEDFLSNPTFRQELIHPDDIHDILRSIPNLFELGRQTHEYRLRKKNGDYIWVLDDVRSIQSEDGKLEGLIGYITDITDLKRTERRLRESEARHRTIFETVLEGIITIDDRGIIQDINGAAEKLFGYESTEIIGKNVSILMPQPHAKNHDEYLERYLETNTPRIIGYGREVVGLRKNGETFHMGLSVSELNLPQGRFFVGCVRDITERVNAVSDLRESQERLTTSQEFANIGTWDWDIESDNLYCSAQVLNLFDVSENSIDVQSDFFLKRAYEEDRSALELAIKACLKEGLELNIEFRSETDSGSIQWHHLLGDVMRNPDGRATRMLGIVQDISERKLREYELEQAKLKADQANRAKSEFLSRMSHELRTPLNAIIGFAQLLGMSRKHPLGERQQTQVNQIETAGQHLLDLINEVLDLARIEAGRLKLSIEKVDIASVVEECLTLTLQQAKEKDISLSCGEIPDVALMVDRTRLKQVLLNLMSNAVKYNNAGGSVDLSFDVSKEDHVRFYVRDTGKGIAPEQHDQIFKPFNRLGIEDSNIEGTGIGLTITHQLTQAMNGDIGFESEVGQGTCFWIELPVANVNEQAISAGNLMTLAHSIELLCIDDNSVDCRRIEQLAKTINNLSVTTASSVESALALAQAKIFDVVLLKLDLANEAGYGALNALRHIPKFQGIPIYALCSEEAAASGKEQILTAGFNGYFILPLKISEITEKILTEWSGE